MECSGAERGGASRPGPCFALLAALALTGCASVEYYAQSVTGHLGLMYRARPVETVIAAPETAPRLAARLRTALEIRDFASDALGLPANASYRRYVDLGRRYVVWSVVAAPELSLAPRHWCFPVAGCNVGHVMIAIGSLTMGIIVELVGIQMMTVGIGVLVAVLAVIALAALPTLRRV